MDVQKANTLLRKINSLYKSIDPEKGQITAIERDLMLSYIRQFYELFMDTAPQESVTDTDGKRTFSRPSEPEVPSTPERPYRKPRIIEIPESLKNLEQEAAPSRKTAPDPPIKPADEQPAAPPPTPNQEMEALFSFSQAQELSEKLSEQPIGNLNKALAINDRLLYMNELFGRDMQSLTESLGILDQYTSMEEAKGFLVSLAEQYDWTDENRKDTAKDFIKLVRRRYF